MLGHPVRGLQRRRERQLAGLAQFLLVAPAREDGEEAVADEAQDLAAGVGHGAGGGVEEAVETVDIVLPPELVGHLRGIPQVAPDDGGARGLAVAALDLAGEHALAGLGAEIGGERALGHARAGRHLAGHRQGVLDTQQRLDLAVGEAAALVARPGAHHALTLAQLEAAGEGDDSR